MKHLLKTRKHCKDKEKNVKRSFRKKYLFLSLIKRPDETLAARKPVLRHEKS